jgi:hypothetical protein
MKKNKSNDNDNSLSNSMNSGNTIPHFFQPQAKVTEGQSIELKKSEAVVPKEIATLTQRLNKGKNSPQTYDKRMKESLETDAMREGCEWWCDPSSTV